MKAGCPTREGPWKQPYGVDRCVCVNVIAVSAALIGDRRGEFKIVGPVIIVDLGPVIIVFFPHTKSQIWNMARVEWDE